MSDGSKVSHVQNEKPLTAQFPEEQLVSMQMVETKSSTTFCCLLQPREHCTSDPTTFQVWYGSSKSMKTMAVLLGQMLVVDCAAK